MNAASPAPAGGISIHAVDVAAGVPARGLEVSLWRLDGPTGAAQPVASGRCTGTGVLDHPCVRGESVTAGVFEARFAIGAYYRAQGQTLPDPAFLEEAVYRFGISDAAQHFHLPLKFTAWGFSLFRGGQ